LNIALVVGFVELDAQTEYNSGIEEGQAGVGFVQPGSSKVMKSAALLVVNTAVPKICGMTLFSHAFPTETSLQSWLSSTLLGVKNV
jgi:hypothetical protein